MEVARAPSTMMISLLGSSYSYSIEVTHTNIATLVLWQSIAQTGSEKQRLLRRSWWNHSWR
jgi:hypothetical protein